MAASKLHLRNVNKDYKLEATDKRTNEGRIVYKNTKTGELHSELSMTLEMPEGSGNWINVPSLINGRVYNVQGVIDMLKAGKITPNSTGHATEDAAVEAAIFRSNNLQDEVGVPLKSNNEIVKSKVVRAYQPAYTSGSGANAEIEAAAEAALASDQQTERLTAIMNNQDLEKQDDYYKYYPNSPRNTDPNWSGTPQPERILNKATQYLDPDNQARLDAAESAKIAERESIIGQAMSAYGPRTGPEVPKPGSRAGSSANLSMGVNQDKHHVSRDRYADMAVNEAENKFQNQDTGFPKTWGERFKDAMSKVAGVAEMSYPGPSQEEIEAARQNALIEERANASDKAAAIAAAKKADLARINANLDPIIKQIEEAKGMNIDAAGHSVGINIHKGEPVPSNTPITEKAKTRAFPGREDARFDANGGYLNTPSDDGEFLYKGLKLNPANQPVAEDEQIYGGGNYNLQPNDDGSFDYGDVPGKSKMRDDGPFDYTGVPLNPNNKIKMRDDGEFNYKGVPLNPKNQRTTIPKDVKPDYGDMPGFKFSQAKGQKEGQGFWSADETSPFWQTDAGYEKAMQTWGEKPGWVKPGYRPKKKELDINAIKKWFTPSK